MTGLVGVAFRELALSASVTSHLNPVAAAAFVAAWLFGPLGVGVVAVVDGSALWLMHGEAPAGALGHTLADVLPALAGLVALGLIPGIGRFFPNLRSYLVFVGSAAVGSAIAAYPIHLFGERSGWSASLGWSAATFESLLLMTPLALIALHGTGSRWTVRLPREIEAKGRLTEPLVFLRGSYERPSGPSRVLVPLLVVLTAISALAVPAHFLYPRIVWVNLLYLAPVLWAALNYGLRAGILASSAGHLSFIVLGGMAGTLFSGVTHDWSADHLGALLILSLLGAGVGSFQTRLRDSRIHEELAVRESEAQLRAIIDNAPEAIVIFDVEAGRFQLVNEYASKLFGWSMEELLELGPAEVSPPTQPDGRPSERAAFDQLSAAVRGEKPVFEWVHQTARGEPIVCEVRLVRLPSRDRLLVRGNVRDLSDIRRTERALEETRERYRRVVEELTEYVVRWTPDGVRTFVNPAYCRLRERSEEELLGANLKAGLSEVQRLQVEDTVRKLERSEAVISDEFPVPQADGTVRWQMWTDRGLYDREGRLIEIQSVGRDITDRKLSEEQLFASQQRLRSLAAELTSTEERERRRLATYLHDEIGQTLAILRMKLARLVPLADPDRIAQTSSEMRALLDDAIAKTRTVTFELSPPVLYELGLEAAAEWIGQRICGENNLEFTFEDDGQAKPLDAQALPLLFRGTRELLMNAVKHAGARSAAVSISRSDGMVRLRVSDDGRGFDPLVLEPGAADGGFGLFSLRERLEFLGGRLEVRSEVGRGSDCVMTVPLAEAGCRLTVAGG